MDVKTCTKCKISKNIREFYKKDSVYYRSRCIPCYSQVTYLDRRDEKLKYQKEYKIRNKETIKEKRKQSYEKNREKILEQNKSYVKLNLKSVREYQYEYRKQRYQTDTLYKLRRKLRGRIQNAFLGGKSKVAMTLLGAEIEFIKDYLEKLFKPGMNWSNHTKDGWHVDHIIPLASADSIEDLEKLCHYTNLQPLWAEENYSKGSKYPFEPCTHHNLG